MVESTKSIHLAGSVLNKTRHVCAFFNSREEEYELLMPFMKEGFERGEKQCHIIDPDHRPERLRWLGGVGIHPDSDQVDVRAWADGHLSGGGFDKDSMLALVQNAMESSKGSDITRWWGNMEWALTDASGVDDLIEYESRLNDFLPDYDDVVVCAYDLNRFSANVVMDVMRTHPMVIIGGILQENPFYVPPDEFLRELKGRQN